MKCDHQDTPVITTADCTLGPSDFLKAPPWKSSKRDPCFPEIRFTPTDASKRYIYKVPRRGATEELQMAEKDFLAGVTKRH